MISQSRKKISKGNSPEEIAELFEEDLDLIKTITEKIQSHPYMSDEEIGKSLISAVSDGTA